MCSIVHMAKTNHEQFFKPNGDFITSIIALKNRVVKSIVTEISNKGYNLCKQFVFFIRSPHLFQIYIKMRFLIHETYFSRKITLNLAIATTIRIWIKEVLHLIDNLKEYSIEDYLHIVKHSIRLSSNCLGHPEANM